jgi:hypothetical protein
MADFYDGKSIIKSFDTNKGIANGWLPVNGKLAVTVPNCETRYWKIKDKKIIEMTAEEKEVIDTPQAFLKTSKQIYSDIMDTFGAEYVMKELKTHLTAFFETCIRQESISGYAMAKLELDSTAMKPEDKEIIKGLIDGA